MLIQTNNAKFLISNFSEKQDFLLVQSNNRGELERLFGSDEIRKGRKNQWPFAVKICKQEFAHSLILLVKEIDYKEFGHLTQML